MKKILVQVIAVLLVIPQINVPVHASSWKEEETVFEECVEEQQGWSEIGIEAETSEIEGVVERLTEKQDENNEITKPVETEQKTEVYETVEIVDVKEENDDISTLENIVQINNAGNNCNAAAEINSNITYGDYLSSNTDMNYYKFVVNEEGYVSISFSHDYTEIDHDLWRVKLYDTEKKEMNAWTYHGKDVTERKSCNIGLRGGTYYVSVEKAYTHSDANYYIRVNHTPSSQWEAEYNNSMDTANVVAVNTTVSGTMFNNNDQDYYKVTIEEDGYLSISFSHDYVNGNYIYWRMVLYNAEREPIGSWDYEGKTEAELTTCNIGLPASTYYVEVGRHVFSDAEYHVRVNHVPSTEWEKEFNDNFETANTISANTAVSGSIYHSEDKDYFKVTTSETGYLSLSFSHDYVESSRDCWRVALYNGSRNKVKEWTYKGYDASVLTTSNIGLPSATYYVEVQRYYHDASDYSLTVNFTPSTEWEIEYNDSFRDANNLEVNTQIFGNLMYTDDDDYYKFTLEEDGYISLSFKHAYVGDNANYWQVKLYNAENNEMLSWIHTGGSEAEELTCNIGVPASTYYILVDRYQNSTIADYCLKVNYTSSAEWETEYNDNFGTAEEVDVNTFVSGSLMHYNDVDYYKFEVTETGYLSLTFAHDYVDNKAEYWTIRLYDNEKNEMAAWSYLGNTEAEISTGNIGVAPSTYYVLVERKNYTAVDYRLKMNHTTSNVWETEFNDSMNTANTIAMEEAIHGSLMKPEDVDYYKLMLEEGTDNALVFAHDYIEDSNAYWRVTLYNGNKEQIDQYYYAGTETRKKDAERFWDAGTYYIKVEKYNYSGASYSLLVGNDAFTKTKLELEDVFNDKGGVTVAWKEIPMAEGYYIYRKNGKKWEKLAQVEGGATVQYTDDTVVSGKTYSYTVKAYAGSEESLYDTVGKKITYVADTVTKMENVSKGIKVTWDKVKGAKGYHIYRVSEGEEKKIATIKGNKVSYIDKKVVSGTAYQYYVCAYSGKFQSVLATEMKDEIYYLEMPKIVKIENITKGIGITWSESKNAMEYKVYRKIAKDPWVEIATTEEAKYIDTSVKAGGKYSYAVRAVINVKDNENAEVVVSHCSEQSVAKAMTYLEEPESISVNNMVQGVEVTWEPTANCKGYAVYRRTESSTWKKVGSVSNKKNSFVDKKAKSGNIYYYTVSSYWGKINSSKEEEGKSLFYIAAPKLKSVKKKDGEITFKWAAVAGADKYCVYRKTEGNEWTKVAEVKGDSCYIDTAIEQGNKYIYTVEAYAGNIVSGRNDKGKNIKY